MKKILYKGIIGVVEDEKIEGDYCGHLLINGGACFYGKTENELMNDFKEVVDFYLENCEQEEINRESVKIIA